MKKILIIDDKIKETNNSGVVVLMADKWREEKAKGYLDLVDIVRTPETYFKWDLAGNDCEALFDTDDYAYIFIHHSQQGDSMLPSNVIDLIKRLLREKLVLFSGSINEYILNTDNPDFVYRSILRQNLWDGMAEFIKKSILLNEWIIDVLYFKYEDELIGRIIEMQDREMAQNEIINSKEMQHFLKLKYVEPDSKKFLKIICSKDFELINELRNL